MHAIVACSRSRSRSLSGFSTPAASSAQDKKPNTTPVPSHEDDPSIYRFESKDDKDLNSHHFDIHEAIKHEPFSLKAKVRQSALIQNSGIAQRSLGFGKRAISRKAFLLNGLPGGQGLCLNTEMC